MQPTRGYKSSEFWITLIVVAIGAAIATGLIPSQGIAMRIAATILMTAKALGYTISRTILKAGIIADDRPDDPASPASPVPLAPKAGA